MQLNTVKHFLPTKAEYVPVVVTAPLHGNKKGQRNTSSDVSTNCCTMRDHVTNCTRLNQFTQKCIHYTVPLKC